MKNERMKAWQFACTKPRVTSRMILNHFACLDMGLAECARVLRELTALGSFTQDEEVGPRGVRYYRAVLDKPPMGSGGYKRLPRETQDRNRQSRRARSEAAVQRKVKPWTWGPELCNAELMVARQLETWPVVNL